MRRITLLAFYLAMLAAVGACAEERQADLTATQDPATVAQATGAAATEAWRNAEATEERQTLVAGEEAATRIAQTAVRSTEVAQDRSATLAAGTEVAVAQATTQAQSMFDRIQELYEQGYLASTSGTYHRVPDFDESWAQLNWYQWWATEIRPTDFVVRADLAWQSASETADWWNSGCGFVFRINEKGDHYVAFLALDGRLYFYRNLNDITGQLASPFAGRMEIPQGSARLEIIGEGSWFTFFVNGERLHSRQDTGLPDGDLALTLVSGTNKDYGIRCQMTNIDVWELE